jgi:hypothetical protein
MSENNDKYAAGKRYKSSRLGFIYEFTNDGYIYYKPNIRCVAVPGVFTKSKLIKKIEQTNDFEEYQPPVKKKEYIRGM